MRLSLLAPLLCACSTNPPHGAGPPHSEADAGMPMADAAGGADTGGGDGGPVPADAGEGDGGDAGACVTEVAPELPLGQRRCDGLVALPLADPARPGPYPVGVRTIMLADPQRPGRTLTTEVWYPADDSARGRRGTTYELELGDIARLAGVDVPFSFGSFPISETDAVRDAAPRAPAAGGGLVIFSHGFRGIRYQSTFLTVHLASHGHVVVAPDHQGNTLFDGSATAEESAADRLMDVAFVTEEMTRRVRSSGVFLAGSFDPARVAWVGHSFGASTALMAGALDNRDILVMPLAPAFDARMAHVYEPESYELRSALVLFSALDDDTTPPADQQLAYDRTVAPRYLISLRDAKHMDFSDVCTADLALLVPDLREACSAAPARVQDAVRTVATSAIQRYVGCNAAAEGGLEPAAVTALPGVAAYESEGTRAPSDGSGPVPVCALGGDPSSIVREVRTVPRSEGGALRLETRTSRDTGPWVLFVHGLSTTSAVFDARLDALAPFYRVAALDLPGHGGSDPSPLAPHGADGAPGTDDDPYRVDAYADAVADAAAALEGPVVLVGWSSGAQASLLAAARSESIAALVLVDGAPLTRMDPALHPAYNGGATLQFGRALTDALASDDWRVVVDTMFTPSAPRALVDGTYAELMSVDAATRRGQLTAPRPDLVDVLGDVRQPTLVIHGERDDTLLVESARFFAAAIPDARIAVLGESGHAPFLEEPERFDRVLVTFLDELDLGSTP